MKKFLVMAVLVSVSVAALGRSVAVLETGKTKASVLNRHQFQYRQVVQDETGTHMRFAQMHQGVDVWGGEVIHHYANGELVLVNGRVHEGIECGTVPVLTSRQAMDRVSADLQDASFDVHGAKLVVFPGDNGDYYLSFQIRADRDDACYVYFVDAETGMILFNYDNLKTRGGPPSSGDDPVDLTPAVGSGIGVLGQAVANLNTGFTGSLYQAVNLTRGAEIMTYDMSASRRLPGVLATDSDNYWTDGSVVDAHKYIENVYDFYLSVFNRASYDNNNAVLKASVHYGTNYVNAYWNGTQMVFGDGGRRDVHLAGGCPGCYRP